MLSGKTSMFDTVGTSDRFGALVPLWRIVCRPLLAWLNAMDCMAAVFAGMFASMIAVVVSVVLIWLPIVELSRLAKHLFDSVGTSDRFEALVPL